MKKTVFRNATVATLLTMGTLSFFPPQSHAIVGAVTGDIPMLAIGGVLVVGSLGADAYYLGVPNSDAWDGLATVFVTLGTIPIGLVLLNSNGQVSPQFTAINSGPAKNLGITSDELSAYNSELPQINALYQTIASDMQKRNQPNTSARELATFADQEWSRFSQQSLSAQAQSALAKVRSAFGTQLHQAVSKAPRK